MLRQPALGDRHADAHPTALTQRTGCRLDASDQMILRVPRAVAVDLTEVLDVVKSDREFAAMHVLGVDLLDASEMQHRIMEHRGVSVGEHESIAIRPDRMVRIEAQKLLPKGINHRCQGHRGARMTGFGLLHGVHGQRANRIDAELVNRVRARRCFRFLA
jgi:hypothetical protein